MSILIAGLFVFLGSHSIGIAADDWRARQVARIGLRPWKLAYSAVSLVGLALIIWGYGLARATPVVLWQAPAASRHVAALFSVIGFVLIAAAYVPRTNIRRVLGHPMTAGVALWALGHLAVNGRLNAVLLFGSFLAWAIATFVTRRRRDHARAVVYPPGSVARDGLAVVIGAAAAMVFAFYLHGPLIGIRPFG